VEILGGPLFSVAGAGESHGPAITTIINGCPPGLRIDRQRVQYFLDRRRPGGNKHGTPRNEKDKVVFLSGLYNAADQQALLSGPTIRVCVDDVAFETESYGVGLTTGEPIAAMVLSTSKKSNDYTQLNGDQGEVRPGHTDLVKFHKSQQFVDVRGGGRSSYRSTISDVIGGAIARQFLFDHFGTVILSSIVNVGTLDAAETLSAHVEDMLPANSSGKVNAEALSAIEQTLEQGEIHSLDHAFAHAAAQHGLLAEQVGFGFLGKRRADHPAAGAADAFRVRHADFEDA